MRSIDFREFGVKLGIFDMQLTVHDIIFYKTGFGVVVRTFITV